MKDEDRTRPPQLRVRISTLLFVIAIVALLVLVISQQVQIERMRRLIAAGAQQRDKLTQIIREQRDHIERHK